MNNTSGLFAGLLNLRRLALAAQASFHAIYEHRMSSEFRIAGGFGRRWKLAHGRDGVRI